MVKGYPSKVIARVLEIISGMVATHLRRIFAKLGVFVGRRGGAPPGGGAC